MVVQSPAIIEAQCACRHRFSMHVLCVRVCVVFGGVALTLTLYPKRTELPNPANSRSKSADTYGSSSLSLASPSAPWKGLGRRVFVYSAGVTGTAPVMAR